MQSTATVNGYKNDNLQVTSMQYTVTFSGCKKDNFLLLFYFFSLSLNFALNLGPNIQGTSNYGTGKVFDWKYVVTAMQLKLCLIKHKQSLIVHYSVILANNQDLLSKSNRSRYCLQVCNIIFQINTLDSFIIVKKPKYPFFAIFSTFWRK